MARMEILLMVLVAVVVSMEVGNVASVGCKEAKMCCQGKDNVCVVEGPRVNRQNNETCFCDSACSLLDDCCLDYTTYCTPVDCLLAEKWQEWGNCDARCGMGVKERRRKVIQLPQNGGQPCGITVQKAVCEGTNCKLPRAPGAGEELRETGKFLPANFGQWRSNKLYNPYRDIRRNLFEKHVKNYLSRPSYCATYELTDVRPGCQSSRQDWSKNLTKGASICVECQSVAMQKKLGGRCHGHGVYLRETRWITLTTSDCHGAWVMKTRREDCECARAAPNLPSFIFV